MIIVRTLAGDVLCYLFSSAQADQFAAECPPAMRFSLTYQHVGPPSFSRDPR